MHTHRQSLIYGILIRAYFAPAANNGALSVGTTMRKVNGAADAAAAPCASPLSLCMRAFARKHAFCAQPRKFYIIRPWWSLFQSNLYFGDYKYHNINFYLIFI